MVSPRINTPARNSLLNRDPLRSKMICDAQIRRSRGQIIEARRSVRRQPSYAEWLIATSYLFQDESVGEGPDEPGLACAAGGYTQTDGGSDVVVCVVDLCWFDVDDFGGRVLFNGCHDDTVSR